MTNAIARDYLSIESRKVALQSRTAQYFCAALTLCITGCVHVDAQTPASAQPFTEEVTKSRAADSSGSKQVDGNVVVAVKPSPVLLPTPRSLDDKYWRLRVVDEENGGKPLQVRKQDYLKKFARLFWATNQTVAIDVSFNVAGAYIPAAPVAVLVRENGQDAAPEGLENVYLSSWYTSIAKNEAQATVSLRYSDDVTSKFTSGVVTLLKTAAPFVNLPAGVVSAVNKESTKQIADAVDKGLSEFFSAQQTARSTPMLLDLTKLDRIDFVVQRGNDPELVVGAIGIQVSDTLFGSSLTTVPTGERAIRSLRLQADKQTTVSRLVAEIEPFKSGIGPRQAGANSCSDRSEEVGKMCTQAIENLRDAGFNSVDSAAILYDYLRSWGWLRDASLRAKNPEKDVCLDHLRTALASEQKSTSFSSQLKSMRTPSRDRPNDAQAQSSPNVVAMMSGVPQAFRDFNQPLADRWFADVVRVETTSKAALIEEVFNVVPNEGAQLSRSELLQALAQNKSKLSYANKPGCFDWDACGPTRVVRNRCFTRSDGVPLKATLFFNEDLYSIESARLEKIVFETTDPAPAPPVAGTR
jgi:hypothetical protein